MKKHRDYVRSNDWYNTHTDEKIRKPGELVNKLPPVGAIVTVWEYKRLKKHSNCENSYTHEYRDNCNERWLDVWGNVKTYEVIEYTKGIENGLDRNNDVLLKRVVGKNHDNGYVEIQRLRTYLIVTGSLFLATSEEAEILRKRVKNEKIEDEDEE